MLSVIDDAGVDRGTIGQYVHTLVDTLADTADVMESIAADPGQTERVRHSAILFAVSAAQSKSVGDALSTVDRLRKIDANSEFASVLSWLEEDLRENDFVSLY